MTKFVPHTALKLIVSSDLTFDERFVLNHVVTTVLGRTRAGPVNCSCWSIVLFGQLFFLWEARNLSLALVLHLLGDCAELLGLAFHVF